LRARTSISAISSRVLQVGVQQRYVLPARPLHPGRHRDLHAEVARQPHEHDVLSPQCERFEQRRRTVDGAVVDVDDLEAAVDPAERLVDAALQLGQPLLLVEDGYDDRDERGSRPVVAVAAHTRSHEFTVSGS